MHFVLISLSLISMVICYLVANQRGASVSYWTTAGFFFGPFAIPFVFFSKSKVDEENLHN